MGKALSFDADIDAGAVGWGGGWRDVPVRFALSYAFRGVLTPEHGDLADPFAQLCRSERQ